MTKFRVLVAYSILVLSGAAAQAGTSVQVNLRDLNPSDPAAATRIQAAAELACGPVRYTSDTRFSALTEADSDHRACVRRATAMAMARIQAATAARPTLARAP
jgi:UrcA family protein